MSRQRVHIIGNQHRAGADLAAAGWSAGTRITQIDPVPAPRWSAVPPVDVDVLRFRALHGRPPLPGEVGCALAHLDSCAALLASPDEWAMVLEDDARVDDATALQARVGEVIAAWPGPEPLIYSFFSERDIRPTHLPGGPVAGSLLLPVTLGGSVCYLLNRSAATLIVASQRPVWSVADWPVGPPEVSFCLDLGGLVGHGSATDVASTIWPASNDPRILPLHVKAQIWSWIWFLRNRGYFDGAVGYRRTVLSRRMFFLRHVR